jgi:hypothetical protein
MMSFYRLFTLLSLGMHILIPQSTTVRRGVKAGDVQWYWTVLKASYGKSHSANFTKSGIMVVSCWCVTPIMVVSCWCVTPIMVVSYWCVTPIMVVSYWCVTSIMVVSCWCVTSIMVVSYWCVTPIMVVSCWCVTPISTIFKIDRGGQLDWRWQSECTLRKLLTW